MTDNQTDWSIAFGAVILIAIALMVGNFANWVL